MDHIRLEFSWAEDRRATLVSLVHNGDEVDNYVLTSVPRGMIVEYRAAPFASHKLRAVLDFVGATLHDLKCDMLVNGEARRIAKVKDRPNFWRVEGKWE